MKIRSIYTILLIFVCLSVSAQTDSVATTTNKLHSETATPMDFRVPDKGKIREFKKDNRFIYSEPVRGISLWDRIKYWLFDKFNDLVTAISKTGFPGVIVIIVIVLAICLIILRIIGVDYRKILGKKDINTPEIDIYTENVHDMNFDTLIANALKNKDYRLVVRFLYLKNLKLLSDKDFIDWKANKTNYSYQYEISDFSLRKKFLEVTLIFDYIWYGEFPLDEDKYQDINTRMNDFNKMIGNER